MDENHKLHIEQLSYEIAWHRKVLEVKVWMRREYIRLDEKRRPVPSAPERWLRRLKRAAALWLLD